MGKFLPNNFHEAGRYMYINCKLSGEKADTL